MTQIHDLLREALSLTPEVLVVGGSHGFPPTKARFSRLGEIARDLTRRGALVDVALLVEKQLLPQEEDQLEKLRPHVRSLRRFDHPSDGSLISRAFQRARDAFRARPVLGGKLHCPNGLLQVLRTEYAPRDYRAIIACGVHLARAVTALPEWTERIVDIERIGHEAHRAHEREGRPDALDIFADEVRELSLLALADAVVVTSSEDAVQLRNQGFLRDLVLAPATGREEPPESSDERAARPDPIRPPRILCIGSETVANLDGARWFRRQVYPRVQRSVPTCRLRLVGEVARHIEPGPGVDRIGWVDSLEEEYRDAALVIVPVRMGSGMRRRAAEALARGKALAATRAGAAGLGLAAGEDAVMADDPEVLAAEIARVLTSDTLRRAYEDRARTIAREVLDPERAFASLAARLGLEAPEENLLPLGRLLASAPLVTA